MEIWQRDCIRKNLTKLLEDTDCTTTFLTRFYADRVLLKEELEILKNINNRSERAYKFYEILPTRKNSYDLLMRVLEDTHQTGALGLLDSENATGGTARNFDLERQMIRSRSTEDTKRVIVSCHTNSKMHSLENQILSRDAVIQKQAFEISELKLQVEVLKSTSMKKEFYDAELKTEQQQLPTRSVIQETTSDITRLQDENMDLRRLIAEKERQLDECNARHFRDQSGNSKLHLAIKKRDEQAIKNLIKLGADVNSKNCSAETPIILAASSQVDGNGALKICKYLLDHGANAFGTGGKGSTFLHKLTSNGSPLSPQQLHELSDYLVSKNLSKLFNIQDNDHARTPLMLAASNVQLENDTISLLLQNCVDPTLLDKHGNSYLIYAIDGNKNTRLVDELRKNGTIKLTLGHAIDEMDEESVKVLVELGADVNESNSKLESPLHRAANLKCKEFAVKIIKLLINSGANPYAKRELKSHTFLHVLMDENNELTASQFHDIAFFLVSKGLTQLFNTPSGNDGATPFHFAARYVDIEMATLSLLKDKGVDFNAVDQDRSSILYWAIWLEKSAIFISNLVALGANPRQLTTTRSSMLHIAGYYGHFDVIKFLLDKGLDINAIDSTNRTPLYLHFCNPKRDISVVTLLVSSGANKECTTSNGVSMNSIFQKKNNSDHVNNEIAKYLGWGDNHIFK